MGLNSASYIGPKIWYHLPNECKLEENPNRFKHKIKDSENDDIYIYY